MALGKENVKRTNRFLVASTGQKPERYGFGDWIVLANSIIIENISIIM